jgi:hypothetical protein
MDACVIFKNKHGQDLMGYPMCVQRREDREARFISTYHVTWNTDVYNNLQNNLEKWWKWNGQQRC